MDPMYWEEEPLREGSEPALEREGPLTGDRQRAEVRGC